MLGGVAVVTLTLLVFALPLGLVVRSQVVASALDGQGRLWIFWSANVKDNWDLFGRFRSGSRLRHAAPAPGFPAAG